ncbi:MAG: DUF2079 domain-containing protein [Acidimicrobiales bacterium]
MPSEIAAQCAYHEHEPQDIEAHWFTEYIASPWIWRTSAALLLVQLGVVLAYSELQYSRFDLSTDFATYNQAVWLIAHGTLNPWSSIHSYRFLDDHFALITYLLAVPYRLFPHGVLLLWIQDLAGVCAELVTVRWIIGMALRHLRHTQGIWGGPALIIGATVVMLADPWFYIAMFFDFHTEALATLFLVLAARAAWNDRLVRFVPWSAALLLCGDLGGLFLVALGVSLVIALPRRWWWGVGALAVGAAWIRLADALGVSKNTFLTGYAYLQSGNPAIGAHVTLTSLLGTLLVHPNRWISIIWERRSILYQNLIPTGVVGLFSAWSSGTIVVVLFSSVLIYPLTFIESGFQNLPAYIVGIAGSAIGLCWLAKSKHRRWRVAGVILGIAIVVQSVIYGIVEVPSIPSQWITVSPSQANVLSLALKRIPSGAEVIADWGVVGRFSARHWIYNLYPVPGTIPIKARTVAFIIVPNQATGNEPLPKPVAMQVIEFLKRLPGSRPLLVRHGIYVYTWQPPRGQGSLTIP